MGGRNKKNSKAQEEGRLAFALDIRILLRQEVRSSSVHVKGGAGL